MSLPLDVAVAVWTFRREGVVIGVAEDPCDGSHVVTTCEIEAPDGDGTGGNDGDGGPSHA